MVGKMTTGSVQKELSLFIKEMKNNYNCTLVDLQNLLKEEILKEEKKIEGKDSIKICPICGEKYTEFHQC